MPGGGVLDKIIILASLPTLMGYLLLCPICYYCSAKGDFQRKLFHIHSHLEEIVPNLDVSMGRGSASSHLPKLPIFLTDLEGGYRPVSSFF